MRETPRDEKWEVERNAEHNGTVESVEQFSGEVVAPSDMDRLIESNMVIVSLLMRLYDLTLATLSRLDDDEATRIYETHAKGGHFNPPIFIPSQDEQEET
jgi:hypothetical protein